MSYRCWQDHPPERYRRRKTGTKNYCLDCQNIRRWRWRAWQRRLKDEEAFLDELAGVRYVGGCKHGHRPERRYRRPNGELRCRDCEWEYNQRRKPKERRSYRRAA